MMHLSHTDKAILKKLAKDDDAYEQLLTHFSSSADNIRLNQYQDMVNNLNDGLVLVNREFIYEVVNPAYLRLTNMSHDDVAGHHVIDVLGSEMFDTLVKPRLEKTFMGEMMRYTVWRDDPHNVKKCLHVTYTPYRNHNNQITGAVVHIRDITEQKSVEEQLAASEARYRTMSKHFPNGMIALYDHDLRYTLIDGSGLQAIGLTSADLIGKRLRDIFPPEIYKRDEPQLKAALQGEMTDEIVALGDEFFRVMTLPIYDDNQQIIAGMVLSQNITSLKRTEAALRTSKENYRLLAENNPDLIARLNIDGVYLYANSALLDFLKLKREDLIGKTIHEIGLSETFQDKFTELIETVLTTGNSVDYAINNPSQNPDGYYHMRILPEFDDNGKIVSLLVISRDITDQKIAEKHKIDLTLETERRQILTHFIQGATHEFRTPLSSIGMSAHLMARLDERDQREVKRIQIEKQIRLLTHLVDSLLLTATLHSPNALQRIPFNLVQTMRNLHQASITDDKTTHTIQLDCPIDRVMIIGDEANFMNALTQLLSNAIRFSDPDSTIMIALKMQDQQAQITITDEGVGISQDHLPKIFNTFWRHDYAHTTAGLGLGLTIAKLIINQHQGQLHINSEENMGTVVEITLPVI